MSESQNDVVDAPVTPDQRAVAIPDSIPDGSPGSVAAALIQLARDPAVDVGKLEALVKMQERIEDRQLEREQRESVQQFNADFVLMQGALPRVKRDGSLEYPMDKNKPDGPKRLVTKYAKWETIHAAIMPVLTDHGFALSFKIGLRQGDGGGLLVSAVLRHRGGHSETGDPFPVPLDTSGGKNNIQAYGSAESYGKRYAAFAALNIATEGADDDGKAAGSKFVSDDHAHDILRLMEEAGITGAKIDQFLLRHTNGPATTPFEVEEADFVRLMNLLSLMGQKKGGGG